MEFAFLYGSSDPLISNSENFQITLLIFKSENFQIIHSILIIAQKLE